MKPSISAPATCCWPNAPSWAGCSATSATAASSPRTSSATPRRASAPRSPWASSTACPTSPTARRTTPTPRRTSSPAWTSTRVPAISSAPTPCRAPRTSRTRSAPCSPGPGAGPGRRFASVANVDTVTNALREGLDQKFEGYYLTGAYKVGSNSFLLRYDFLDYNSNNAWYGAANPYHVGAADYTPKYKETTLGYTYALDPGLVKSANVKVNYIIRSKNFLKPLAVAGQTTEQGGNTLMAAFQVAF